MAEVAELRAKETRRLALKRACRARYRVRHPERVAEYRRRYYAQNRERIADNRRQYRARNAERVAEQQRVYQARYIAKRKELMRRYYASHADRLRSSRKRESAALLRQQRGSMVQKATEEKRQALGLLQLTVTVEDFMKDFCNSLSPSPEDSIDQPGTLMDMDSGVFHPLDHSECDESSCDMWDEGKGFLDNLLDDLSSSDDSLLLDLDDFLTDMMEDSSFDLDEFVM